MPTSHPGSRSVPPDFPAASDAAREWLALLLDVQRWGERANDPAQAALVNLKPSDYAVVACIKLYELAVGIDRYGPVVEAAYPALAAISHAPVRHYDGRKPRSFASAHEAVLELSRDAVLTMLELPGLRESPFIDGWQETAEVTLAHYRDRFTVSAELDAHLRWERAKLVPPDGPRAARNPLIGALRFGRATVGGVARRSATVLQRVADRLS